MKLSTAAISAILGAAAIAQSKTITTAIGAIPARRGSDYQIQFRQVTTPVVAAPAPGGRGPGYQIQPREVQDEVDKEFER